MLSEGETWEDVQMEWGNEEPTKRIPRKTMRQLVDEELALRRALEAQSEKEARK